MQVCVIRVSYNIKLNKRRGVNLASLVEELISVLEEECEIYDKLLPIAEEKTNVIIKNDLETLRKITIQEHETVDKVSALERKRERVIFDIATVLNQDKDTLNLVKIVQLLEKQPKEQKILGELHNRLKKTVSRLVDINFQNKSLIEQSLEMIEFNMNLIQSTRTLPGNNYTKGATTIDAPSLQAGTFDAKQ